MLKAANVAMGHKDVLSHNGMGGELRSRELIIVHFGSRLDSNNKKRERGKGLNCTAL